MIIVNWEEIVLAAFYHLHDIFVDILFSTVRIYFEGHVFHLRQCYFIRTTSENKSCEDLRDKQDDK
jgi:hypothetical protein